MQTTAYYFHRFFKVFFFFLTILSLSHCDSLFQEPEVQDPTPVLFIVAPYRETCQGVVEQQCFLVKKDEQDSWTYFYDTIIGFDYEEGFTYRLLVRQETVTNPPADGSMYRYTLQTILAKE